MRKKFFYLCLVIAIAVIGYVAYKSVMFSKYANKLEISNAKPVFTLESLVNNKSLKVKYLKSFNYERKCIGFNAIVNNENYITVTKLGKSENQLKINKSHKDFKESNIIGFPPIDVEEQISRYVNFENYPFDVREVDYYIDGQELYNFSSKFPEIVFKGKYINFSFNDKNKKDFGYVTPTEIMSVSFITYNNELYIINTKQYKNYPFKSLHSLLKID